MAQAHPERASNGHRLQPPPSHGSKDAPEQVRRTGWATAAAAALVLLAGPSRTASAAADPQGVWMIEDEVAIAVARCGAGSLCGRVLWLRTPRDAAGRPKRDTMNPDAALRERPLCGLTVLDGLLPVPGKPPAGGMRARSTTRAPGAATASRRHSPPPTCSSRASTSACRSWA
jgi:hypothetical protein